MDKLLHINYYKSIFNLFILNQTIWINIIYFIIKIFPCIKHEPILVGISIGKNFRFNGIECPLDVIISKIYNIYPNIRILIRYFNYNDFNDYIKTNKLLSIYSSNKWDPSWFLIPGQLWDNNQGDNLIDLTYLSNSERELKYINMIDGINESKDINSIKVSRTIVIKGQVILMHSSLSFDDFICWVSSSLTDDLFLSMQNQQC